LELTGRDIKAVHVSPELLETLPRIEQTVAFQTSKGVEQGQYEGVLLWDLLKSAGATELPGHHAELQRIFVVTGRDHYSVAFSLGEISPEFGGRRIMIAERVDGEPLPPGNGLRLVVPGDKRGARSVRDVVAIEIR
jgi:DMSO/TMAO reductase YedYZ molybdopterin-dependent catalytic subunit